MTYSDAHRPDDLSLDAGSAGALLRDLEWVQRLAFRLCSDWALAEDLRQEAALALLGHEPESKVGRRQWLAGVVRNKLRMKRRSDGRRRAREAGVSRPEEISQDVDVVERAETQRVVADAVLQLREPYRTTVLHRFFDQWTPTEIAERTGTSVETVKSRLKRGLKELESDLSGTFGDGTEETRGAGWYSALMPLAVMESNRRTLAATASGAQGLTTVSIATAGLLPMMSKVLFIPLALLTLYGAFLLTRPSVNGDATTTAAAPAVTGTLATDRDAQAIETPADSGRSLAPAPSSANATTSEALPLTYDLSGHVMDDRGRDQAGARVVLYGKDGEPLEATTTGPDGRFALSVPQQAEQELELRVEGDGFHRSERLGFGERGRGARLPLIPGSRDVGTLVLDAAGAVSGTVVDADGAPVGGATVTTWGGRTTTTTPDGSFRIDRLLPGDDCVEVRADGAPIAEVEFMVVASSEVEGVEVRLRPSRWLSGRVVDRRGQPVADALVELDPLDRSDVSQTRSGDDGRFEIPWLWLEDAYLRVNAEGFDLWDSEEWDQEFSPDAGEIRVELNAAGPLEFLVVDADTDQPIERYGIEIQKGAGTEGMQFSRDADPAVQDHPGGRAVAEARDEYDRVVITAPGYERFSRDADPNGTAASGTPLQTVRLQRIEAPVTASIEGRVLRNGTPLANAFVEAEGGIPMGERLRELTGTPGPGFVSTLTSLPLARTAADGSFKIDGLTAPLVRVSVHSLSGSTTELPIIELAEGTTMDLGDIDCGAGGTLRGQVVMPPGVSPSGLVASIGWGLGSVRAPLDGGGNFELLHAPAGTQTVDISGRDGDFEYGTEAEVFIREGEINVVQIDASGMGMARVRLQIDLDGAPADSMRVLFLEPDDAESVVGVAFCDGSGAIDVRLPAVGEVDVCLVPDLGGFLRHPSTSLRLENGADIEEVLSFEFGTASVALDVARTLPPDGSIAVVLLDRDGVSHQRLVLEIEDGQVLDSPDASWSAARSSDGGFVLDLHRALRGDWTIEVSTVAFDLFGEAGPSIEEPETWLEGRAVSVR